MSNREREYEKYHKQIEKKWIAFSEEHGAEDMELLLKLGENIDEIRGLFILLKNNLNGG